MRSFFWYGAAITMLAPFCFIRNRSSYDGSEYSNYFHLASSSDGNLILRRIDVDFYSVRRQIMPC